MSYLNALKRTKWRAFLSLQCAFALTGVFAPRAWAFPELSRHGYVNCTACHVSPGGGGLLNSYGRELSRELVSFRSAEGEQQPLHGWVNPLRTEKLPENVHVGGNVRAIQTLRDTATVRQGMFLLMQAEVELGWRPGPLTLVGALGRQTDGTQAWIGSHRYWAGVSPTEESMLRAGLFYPVFGLNLPEHFFSVRRGMGFDEGMETWNLEASWLGERLSAYLTGGIAANERVERAQRRDSTISAQINWHLSESSRIGISALWGNARSGGATQAAAIHGTTPLFARTFLMGELNAKWIGGTQTANRYLKLGYEPWNGWVFALFNDSALSSGSGCEGLGASVQLFPRPHFQVELAAEKQFSTRSMPEGDTFGWLLFHYYI